MSSLELSLPDHLKEFVDTRVCEDGYASASEYLRELITADQKRRAQQHLESLLLADLDSGPAVEFSAQDWSDLRQQVRERTGSTETR
jgi:antitoxin ParD1/3/4